MSLGLEEVHWHFRRWGFGIGQRSHLDYNLKSTGKVRAKIDDTIWSIPYGFVVVPVTLISAWLVLGKLMRRERLYARRHRQFRIQTTHSKHELPIAPNRLKQNFTIQKLNQVWLTDFTYVHTREGFTYLCTVQDLCSRKIVGWTAGRSVNAQLALDALDLAIALRNPEPGLILHSDRGAQFASLMFRQRLHQRQFQQSMSRKRSCYDNAPMESFFKSYKCEEVSRQTYDTHEQVVRHAADYIEHFYNRNRPHSSINYQTPIDFENNLRQPCTNV